MSNAYFFDSIGHSPNFYGHEISEWFSQAAKNAQMLETNTYRTQPEYSVLCGLHVLYVLYFLARGESLSSVIGKFSVSDLSANDRLVQQFAYRLVQQFAYVKISSHPLARVNIKRKQLPILA